MVTLDPSTKISISSLPSMVSCSVVRAMFREFKSELNLSSTSTSCSLLFPPSILDMQGRRTVLTAESRTLVYFLTLLGIGVDSILNLTLSKVDNSSTYLVQYSSFSSTILSSSFSSFLLSEDPSLVDLTSSLSSSTFLVVSSQVFPKPIVFLYENLMFSDLRVLTSFRGIRGRETSPSMQMFSLSLSSRWRFHFCSTPENPWKAVISQL